MLSLEHVDLPSNLTTINTMAFYGCRKLKNIVILDSVTQMGYYVFDDCVKLNSVNIPTGIRELKSCTFAGCTSLQNITVPGNVKVMTYAFYGCSSLTNVILEEGIEELQDSSFAKCSALESIVIPDSVTVIGSDVFSYCENLQNIKLSNNLQDIGAGAFYECKSLKKIVIPNSVVWIRTYAFKKYLEEVCYLGTQEEWDEIDIFDDNDALKAATITFGACIHIWNDSYTTDTPATCTVEGSESIHGSVCDEIKEGSSRAIPKLEHNYDDWNTVTEPTFDETGLKERTCSACGYVEQEVIEKKQRISIKDASVSISAQTYTGMAFTPEATVAVDGATLVEDTDYSINYQNNINAGTAIVTITGLGKYTGTATATFTINKAPQTITTKVAASSVAVGKTTTVSTTGAQGTVTYKSSDTTIATVNKTTGKVTAKKVATVKITATAAATTNY